MEKKYKILTIFILSIIILGISGKYAFAQEADSKYFPETGHWINGAFLEFYEDAENPILIYGYPITEAYIDDINGPSAGLFIQYFHKARFELHPNNPPGEQVVLTPIGVTFYEEGISLELDSNNPACHQAPGWNYPICYSFLFFFNTYGEESQFGKPISGLVIDGNRVVQYFENTRMEWQPDSPTELKINLSNFGISHFYLLNGNLARLQPIQNSTISINVTNLLVRGFMGESITTMNDEQSFFVIVRDQNNSPITNAQVVITVEYPSGNQTTLPTLFTSELGIAKSNIKFNENTIGSAIVRITVTFGNLTKTFTTTFRIWY